MVTYSESGVDIDLEAKTVNEIASNSDKISRVMEITVVQKTNSRNPRSKEEIALEMIQCRMNKMKLFLQERL